jgi:hypothetical protein
MVGKVGGVFTVGGGYGDCGNSMVMIFLILKIAKCLFSSSNNASLTNKIAIAIQANR